jgi:hypothetical protein
MIVETHSSKAAFARRTGRFFSRIWRQVSCFFG